MVRGKVTDPRRESTTSSTHKNIQETREGDFDTRLELAQSQHSTTTLQTVLVGTKSPSLYAPLLIITVSLPSDLAGVVYCTRKLSPIL